MKLGALTALCVLACASTGNHPLWHDELHTFYIANAATLHRGLEELLAFVRGCRAIAVLGGSVLHVRGGSAPLRAAALFFSLTLLSYDTVLTPVRRGPALAGVAVGTLGMIASHAFSPFSIFPFLLAEAVRFYRSRKPDFPLWAALILPLSAMALYVPLVRGFQSVLFPVAFQPTLLTPRLRAPVRSPA